MAAPSNEPKNEEKEQKTQEKPQSQVSQYKEAILTGVKNLKIVELLQNAEEMRGEDTRSVSLLSSATASNTLTAGLYQSYRLPPFIGS